VPVVRGGFHAGAIADPSLRARGRGWAWNLKEKVVKAHRETTVTKEPAPLLPGSLAGLDYSRIAWAFPNSIMILFYAG